MKAKKKTTGSKRSPRGGSRPGAGRPSLGKRRNVVLDEERWAKALRLGRAQVGPKGTAADGIRFALDKARE